MGADVTADLVGTHRFCSESMMRTLCLYLPLFGYFFLLAEALTLDPSITSLIGNGITVVVLAWYVIYDVKTRTPSMLKTFEETIEKTRVLFANEQTANRQFFQDEQREMRSFYDRQVLVYQQMLVKALEEMRRAVHDTKEVAHEAVVSVKADAKETIKRVSGDDK